MIPLDWQGQRAEKLSFKYLSSSSYYSIPIITKLPLVLNKNMKRCSTTLLAK